MSEKYAPVLWNRQKRIYDLTMGSAILMFLMLFVGLQIVFYPEITAETLIIRATGTLSFLMLHIILCIGPLARLDKRLLPLLYNRRHLGVTMCCIALVHGIFNIVQFHALGNTDPLVSLFTSNPNYGSFTRFPFEVFGFIALLIIVLMGATSHDFWLKNLTPKVWKTLHMLVYWAYVMLVMHVMLGVIQLEKSPALIALTGLGFMTVSSLHIWSAQVSRKQTNIIKIKINTMPEQMTIAGFTRVCPVSEIADTRAKTIMIDGENIAIFKYENKLSAVNNMCRHQNGPLGEGKIIDGCITCPWHGYQYLPHNGQSPPPFREKVETYDVKILGDWVFVNPKPFAPGTERPPCIIDSSILSLQ